MTFIQKQALWVSRDADGNINLHFPTTHVAYVEGGVATVNGATPDENKNVAIDVGVKKVNGATPDADGNVAIEDYITGASINGKTITLNFKDGTSQTLTTQDTVPTDYVSNLSISGKTITVTFKNGTTKTLTTQDTTYSVATTSTAGLMSAADKKKLDTFTTSLSLKYSTTVSYPDETTKKLISITGLTANKPVFIIIKGGWLGNNGNSASVSYAVTSGAHEVASDVTAQPEGVYKSWYNFPLYLSIVPSDTTLVLTARSSFETSITVKAYQ